MSPEEGERSPGGRIPRVPPVDGVARADAADTAATDTDAFAALDEALVEAMAGPVEPLIVVHRAADRDAVGSALGLRALLGGGVVCTPGGPKPVARPLLADAGVDPVVDPPTHPDRPVVVLDTSSSDRIAPVNPVSPVVVDHHEPGDLIEPARAAVVDPDAGATAELVALWAASTGRLMPPRAALPLAIGLLADTAGLEHGTGRTVRVAARLLGSLGPRTADLPRLFEVSDRGGDAGEHNAMRLGALRATGYRAGDTVVAFTNIGGYEAAAATALRSVGVDLAVVCSERETGLHVVARAGSAFAAETNLGATLLPALADRFGGDGGGHAGAGAASLGDATVAGVVAATLEFLEAERGVSFTPIEHTPGEER